MVVKVQTLLRKRIVRCRGSTHASALIILAFWSIVVTPHTSRAADAEFEKCHDLIKIRGVDADELSVSDPPPLDRKAGEQAIYDHAIKIYHTADDKSEYLVAARLLERLVDSSNSELRMHSIGALANIYQHYLPTKPNLRRALSFRLELALKDEGYKPALKLAEMYEFGIGIAPDYKSAGMWYWRASIETGEGEADFRLAELYRRGKLSYHWGDLYSQKFYEVVDFLEGGTQIVPFSELLIAGDGVEQNENRAEKLLNGLRLRRDGAALLLHDIKSTAGRENLQYESWTFEQAVELAKSGDVDGLFNAGFFAAIGRKTYRDLLAARQWLKQAALAGHQKAPFLLAYLQYHDLPFMPEEFDIRELLLLSAERGYWRSKKILGEILIKGILGHEDAACGRYWFEKGLLSEAARQGPSEVAKVKSRIASEEQYFSPPCKAGDDSAVTKIAHVHGYGVLGGRAGTINYGHCTDY